ncbi:MAG TPA: NAD(P)H-binding protein [Actinomycetota bacterium]
MDPILVTGGTGTLGRRVVARLKDGGNEVRVLTRQAGKQGAGVGFVTGDLSTGVGIDAAVEGVATIVHCAGSNKGDDTATRNLVHAIARTGDRPHMVYISVVGAERVPVHSGVDRTMFGYFDNKRKTELVVEGSGLPWTTLRASQFHDLMYFVLEKLTKLPVVPVPSDVSFQPVETDEVAAELVALALGPASGLVPDIAGPRVYSTSELVHGYLRATKLRRWTMPVRLPGGAARALRAGANLAPDRAVGHRTWEDYLADRLAQSAQVA